MCCLLCARIVLISDKGLLNSVDENNIRFKSNIPFYSAKIQPLQDQETYLFNLGLSKGKPDRFTLRALQLEAGTGTERAAFDAIQFHFKDRTILTYANLDRFLFVDIDLSKRRGYGIMVCHVEDDRRYATDPTAVIHRGIKPYHRIRKSFSRLYSSAGLSAKRRLLLSLQRRHRRRWFVSSRLHSSFCASYRP